MCTVSVLPLLDPSGVLAGVRIVSNRDELRTRAPSSPPSWRRVRFDPARPTAGGMSGERETRAIWPMDIEAGGTWIGASRDGLVLSLLNLNLPGTPAGAGRVSRGLIIPSLIGAPDVADAIAALDAMPLPDFDPFRLVAIGAHASERTPRVAEASWDGRRLRLSWHALAPMCFASSGLGDHLVTPRIALFESMVIERGATPALQDEFHGHRWPDRPEISVLMSRGDARTVSITSVEVAGGTSASRPPAMSYTPIEASDAHTSVGANAPWHKGPGERRSP